MNNKNQLISNKLQIHLKVNKSNKLSISNKEPEIKLFVWVSFTAQSTLLKSYRAGQITYSHFCLGGLITLTG